MNNKNKQSTNINPNFVNNQGLLNKNNKHHNNPKAQKNQDNCNNSVKEIDMKDNSNKEANNENLVFNCKEFILTEKEIYSIIKKGQTKQSLNNLANKMIEDLRGKFF